LKVIKEQRRVLESIKFENLEPKHMQQVGITDLEGLLQHLEGSFGLGNFLIFFASNIKLNFKNGNSTFLTAVISLQYSC